MEACRFCGCQGLWKIGTSTGKQRYKCKNCGKSQAEVDDRVKYSDEERRRALVLYLEGCEFRRIARIMKEFFGKEYNYQTIVNWVKRAGMKAMNEVQNHGKIDVLEMDELYTYIQKNKEKPGYGLLLTGKRCALLRLK